MSKYIALRTFSKPHGMAFAKDVLEDIPEPYLTDWTSLGLIEPYDESSVNHLPESIVTVTEQPKRQVLQMDKPTGKPKNAKKK